MLAWVLEKHGAPLRAFALREHPDPVPAAGQILIRSEGFGLNFAEVMARRGLYREAPPPPCVLGYEAVGRVVACGAGAPQDLLGRRVAAIVRFGGYAQLVTTDHRAVVEIPDDMPLGVATALPVQGITAWYMARVAWPLRKGQRVLVHSAAGGVGHLLVQLAVHHGCEVFAVAAGKMKMSALHDLGAHHVVDRSAGDYADQLAAMLGTDRLDVSFNAVGGSTFKKDLRLLGNGSAMVMYGGSERGSGRGPLATLGFVWRMGLVVPIFLMMRSKSLIGVNMLKIGDHHPALLRECLHGVLGDVKEGWLKPQVQAEFPHERLAEAHALLEGGSTMGKVVLRWS